MGPVRDMTFNYTGGLRPTLIWRHLEYKFWNSMWRPKERMQELLFCSKYRP